MVFENTSTISGVHEVDAKHLASNREASPPRKKKKFALGVLDDESSVATMVPGDDDDLASVPASDCDSDDSPPSATVHKMTGGKSLSYRHMSRKSKLCSFSWRGHTMVEGKYDNQKHEVQCVQRDDDSSINSIMTPTTISLTTYEDYNTSNNEDEDNDCSLMNASRNWEAGFNCVSFTSKPPTVIEIPSRDDFTPDEVTAAWYTREEKRDMQEEAYDLMELDAFTSERSDQRKLHRVRVLVAVLREQRRQRSCGELVVNGDELLYSVCYPVSSRCQQLAQIQGQRDEIEAQRLLRNDQSGTRDTSPDLLLKLTRMLRDINVK